MRSVITVAAALSLTFAAPAYAALSVGVAAPDFTVDAALGPKSMTITLSELLKTGPVVIFFVPTIFTGNSADECRDFADNIDKFRAAGATVIGMSRDAIDALADFSTKQTAGKLLMASAGEKIVNGFDVNDSANFTTRTTYVIAPGGKIAFVDNDDDYTRHAKTALAFVEGMKR